MHRRRILITGACGFTGRHLSARLADQQPAAMTGLDSVQREVLAGGQWTYVRCDLSDRDLLRSEVHRASPDLVFHLAGLIRADSPDEFHRVNVEGFRGLLSALRQDAKRRGRKIRVVAVGSAAEIGLAGVSCLPVTEDAPCRPDSDYGRSKWEATRLALAEPADGPLEVIVARVFNLIGPGQGTGSAPGSFAHQVAAVARGDADAIRCGNLDARRDFVDVRDAADAYIALARHGRPGQLYNVCAGRSYRIGDLLDHLLRAAGSRAPVLIEPSRIRANDVPDIYGDHGKVTRETGWQPAIPIHQSLAELLESVSDLRRAA
ncbi:MAG: NAD-dependent epimerase/dehydratase family protein [Pirellulales bacterium]|nr:NAD-dependent epimerase/dehydratase family protein [Pirellulales bacterium]